MSEAEAPDWSCALTDLRVSRRRVLSCFSVAACVEGGSSAHALQRLPAQYAMP